MKRIFKGMVLVIMVVLVLGSLAYARGGGSRYGMNLTGKTIDISGTIQAVDFTPPQIEIKVDVNGKIVEVELGPVNQYDSKDFQIGSAVSLNGEYVEDDVFIPYSLKINDKTYELRDESGHPLWAGKGNDDQGSGYRNRNQNCVCDNCPQNRWSNRNNDKGNSRGMMGHRSRNR